MVRGLAHPMQGAVDELSIFQASAAYCAEHPGELPPDAVDATSAASGRLPEPLLT